MGISKSISVVDPFFDVSFPSSSGSCANEQKVFQPPTAEGVADAGVGLFNPALTESYFVCSSEDPSSSTETIESRNPSDILSLLNQSYFTIDDSDAALRLLSYLATQGNLHILNEDEEEEVNDQSTGMPYLLGDSAAFSDNRFASSGESMYGDGFYGADSLMYSAPELCDCRVIMDGPTSGMQQLVCGPQSSLVGSSSSYPSLMAGHELPAIKGQPLKSCESFPTLPKQTMSYQFPGNFCSQFYDTATPLPYDVKLSSIFSAPVVSYTAELADSHTGGLTSSIHCGETRVQTSSIILDSVLSDQERISVTPLMNPTCSLLPSVSCAVTA